MNTDSGFSMATSECGRVTVAMQATGGNFVRVAAAYASPDEKKIRRKVGEYWAMLRLFDDHSMVMPASTSTALDLAEYFAGSMKPLIWPSILHYDDEFADDSDQDFAEFGLGDIGPEDYCSLGDLARKRIRCTAEGTHEIRYRRGSRQ